MSEPVIVPYRPELLPDVLRLWEESEYTPSPERRRALFQWLTERNPFLRGRPPYWCLHDGERIVGMHGHMPVVLDVDGREMLGHMAQDDLLSPTCRGKGLGQVLLHGAMAAAPDFAAAMWFNEANHRSYAKAGWVNVPGFRRYVRFLDAGRLAREIDRAPLAAAVRVLGPLALRAIDLPARLRRTRLELRPVDRFDARFDALWERVKGGLGIAVRRDSSYLNWRFVEKPFTVYRRVAAYDAGGEPRGYVVYRARVEEHGVMLRLVDVLAEPGSGALVPLVLRAVDEGRAIGASHVVAAASQPALVSTLRRLGFLPNRREEYHMISNWEQRFAAEVVSDARRWYLTFSDADGDVWVDSEADVPGWR